MKVTDEEFEAMIAKAAHEAAQAIAAMPMPEIVPSPHGKYCPANGENPNVECQCDECDHFLFCFPDWKDHI